MAGRNPFLTMVRDTDLSVLNRPQELHGVIFWHGIQTQAQPVKITVVTSVIIDNEQGFYKQILGLLTALQYLGIHVDLPYVLTMGKEELQITIEAD